MLDYAIYLLPDTTVQVSNMFHSFFTHGIDGVNLVGSPDRLSRGKHSSCVRVLLRLQRVI
jgi:hypothetical protein